MRARVEYFWLSLLLVAAFVVLLFYEQTDGTQDNNRQQTEIMPNATQQMVKNNSEPDRVPQTLPLANIDEASPNSSANVEAIDWEGARGLTSLV